MCFFSVFPEVSFGYRGKVHNSKDKFPFLLPHFKFYLKTIEKYKMKYWIQWIYLISIILYNKPTFLRLFESYKTKETD